MITKEKLLSKTKQVGSCWVWQGGHGGSIGQYGRVSVKHGVTLGYAHRISWELHVGPIPAGLSVLHKCDVPDCVNPEHLFLGTQEDNMKDMAAKKRGNAPRGSAHRSAVLNESSVVLIRNSSQPASILAEKYGVSYQTIYAARRGTTWRHVT